MNRFLVKSIEIIPKILNVLLAFFVLAGIVLTWITQPSIELTLDRSINIIRGLASTASIFIGFTGFSLTFCISFKVLQLEYDASIIGTLMLVILIAVFNLGAAYYNLYLDNIDLALNLAYSSLFLSLGVISYFIIRMTRYFDQLSI